MNSQLTHNKTYAHRLPPTLIEQARYWANFHEEGVFTDKNIDGIGNSAVQTLLSLAVSDCIVLSRWAFASQIRYQLSGADRLRWRPVAVPP